MLKLFIFFILFSSVITAKDFFNGKTSIYQNYRHDSFSWKYGKIDNNEPNSIKEEIKGLNLYQFKIDSTYLFSNNFHISGDLALSIGLSNKLNTDWLVQALDNTKTFSSTSLGSFSYKGKENAIDTSVNFGYQFRMGPLFFRPAIGFSYNRQHITRKKISENYFSYLSQGNLVTMTFSPYGSINNQWFSSLIGLHAMYNPINENKFGFSGSYLFGIGKMYQNNKFKAKTDVTITNSTFRNLNYYIKSDALALSHHCDIKAFIMATRKIILGANFSYQYWRGKNGDADYNINGYEQIAYGDKYDILERETKNLSKLKLQTFTIGLFISFK
jgi:hypothetical protein